MSMFACCLSLGMLCELGVSIASCVSTWLVFLLFSDRISVHSLCGEVLKLVFCSTSRQSSSCC